MEKVNRMFSAAIIDILNPQIEISLALFVSMGYILTLLMPANIVVWQVLFWLTLILPMAGLMVLAGRKWKKNEISAKRFSWRALLPLFPCWCWQAAFTSSLRRHRFSL